MDQHLSYKYIVICHLFYPDEIGILFNRFSVINDDQTLFVFNVGVFDKGPVIETIRKRFTKHLIYTNPNKGRDIGAKLFLINAVLSLGITGKYVLIVHDKKSPHLNDGDIWRNDLLKILEPRNLIKMDEIFRDDNVGIVTASKFIVNEYDPDLKRFKCTSNLIIQQLLKEMKLKLSDHSFVAGNIFFIRFDILKNFFSNPDSLVTTIIPTFESGNVLDFNRGTVIHSWERILSWTATSQGYKIYGIE